MIQWIQGRLKTLDLSFYPVCYFERHFFFLYYVNVFSNKFHDYTVNAFDWDPFGILKLNRGYVFNIFNSMSFQFLVYSVRIFNEFQRKFELVALLKTK